MDILQIESLTWHSQIRLLKIVSWPVPFVAQYGIVSEDANLRGSGSYKIGLLIIIPNSDYMILYHIIFDSDWLGYA